jgi:shikimate dehydrogenase
LDDKPMNGLLGKKLSHSYSPWIHQSFGASDYQLIETDDPVTWLKTNDFQGVNVTIPYKETILPALDVLDPIAKRIGAVNTVCRRDGLLYGYNTDVDGLFATFSHHQIDVRNKTAVIIGAGGAAKCAAYVLHQLGATTIFRMTRTKRLADDLEFHQIEQCATATIVINATPIGMSPNEALPPPFSLKAFKQLEVFVDMIYNPLQTLWMKEARGQSAKVVNGLYMLVMQAKKAREIIDQTVLKSDLADEIYRQLKQRTQNLVLIGMPLSGKTTIAKELAKRLHLPVRDSDQEITDQTGQTIESLFASKGEPFFRALEAAWVQTNRFLKGSIVSTGGGMIENQALMDTLHFNGFVVFLDKSPDQVGNVETSGRPLLKDPQAYQTLYQKRRPMYLANADLVVNANQSESQIIQTIEVAWHEVSRY